MNALRSAPRLLALSVAFALCSLASAESEETPPSATFKITYLTGGTVYVDAGSDDGLNPGAQVEVLRDGAVIAVLTVVEVSNHRATCSRAEGGPELAVGDAVRFAPAARETAAAVAAAPAAAASGGAGSALRRAGLRGRVGVRFLAVSNRDNDVADFNQPALELLFLGQRIGGSGWNAAVDVRARRTTRTSTGSGDSTDSENRVYRLAFGYETPRGLGVTLGRQYSPSLANVSTFDGLSARLDKPRFSAGLFGGSQPDPVDYGYDSTIREYGGFVEWHGAPQARQRWHVGLGAVGSYEESEINREFVFVQARVVSQRLFGYAVQELDVNRGWKKELENESITPTSTFVSLRYTIVEAFGLLGGYDNRRSVRLFRDRVTPETEFDDSFRRGVWAGAFARAGQRVRFDLEARQSSGETAGESSSYTGSAGFGPYTGRSLHVRGRATRYENDLTEGWLVSTSASFDVAGRVSLALDGGVRDDNPVADPASSASLVWYGAEVDVPFGRSWFLLFALEHTDGDLENVDQVYTTLSYQF